MKKFIYSTILILFTLTSCETKVLLDANGHEYVDLGLPSGTCWATMNVGAYSPEDYGDYFAWAETEPKKRYTPDTYKWCKDGFEIVTKYCTNSEFGNVDNRTVIERSDDAANVNWGGNWRMPTKSEWDELFDYCTLNVDNIDGVDGLTLVGPNGKSIFLPAAGIAEGKFIGAAAGFAFYYWTSSLLSEYDDAVGAHAWMAAIYKGDLELYEYFEGGWTSGLTREVGCSIRPVLR